MFGRVRSSKYCQQETMPSRLDNSDSALYMRHEELEFFTGG